MHEALTTCHAMPRGGRPPLIVKSSAKVYSWFETDGLSQSAKDTLSG
jgi:hypothetical protein